MSQSRPSHQSPSSISRFLSNLEQPRIVRPTIWRYTDRVEREPSVQRSYTERCGDKKNRNEPNPGILLAAVLIAFLLPPRLVAAKKPVTLETLSEHHATGPGEPVWARDGKRFAYLDGSKLMLRDAVSKDSSEILDLELLQSAATPVPEERQFDWQNRHVHAETIEWTSDGANLLVSTKGDLFFVHLDTRKWDQLTSTPEVEADPKLSPDGKSVAFRRGHDLYVLDVATRKVTRLTEDGSPTLFNAETDWVYPEELDLGTAYWWAPDSSKIAYLQFDVSQEFVYPQTSLLGLRAIYEPERYPQAGTPNAVVRLGVVGVGAGDPPQTHWMNFSDTRDSLLARVAWTSDSSALIADRLNRVQDRLDLVRANASTGQSSVILRESDKYWINTFDAPRILKTGEFLWSSERDGFRHLYLYAANGREESRLTEGNWEVTGIAGIDEARREVYYVSSEASPLERQLYRVSYDGKNRTRLSHEPGTHAISMSPACNYYIDRFSSLAEPPRSIIYSRDGVEVSIFRPADRHISDDYDLRPVEVTQVKAKDGTLLYAKLIKPVNFEPGHKYPVVVFVYGGPQAQSVVNSWEGAGLEQVLAHRGYVVWQLDNRGSSGRGHAFETPLYRRFGKMELADQLDGIHYLESLGFIDSSRIGIFGWSYGGYMTIYSLLNAPDVFHAGVAGAPVTNWHNYDTIYTERYLGLPSANPDAYRLSSDVTYADNLKGKLLILHNMEDDNVLFQNTLQMANALERAGKQFRMIIYPQKTHGVSGLASRQLNQALVEFFDDALK